VYVNLSPVVTLVAARFVLAEPIALLQLVGAALVLLGVYLSERGARSSVSVDGNFEAERAPMPANRRRGSRLC